MKLILLGAPGAGKGTQAEIISERLSIPVLGTGNLIRDAIKAQTPAGVKAKAFVESGGLVPDEIVIALLQERMEQADCANGYILDGFPRNVAQAEALKVMNIAVDRVINIHVADEAIAHRMGGRRVCTNCGASYHTEYNPPKQDGICDSCGGELAVRKDDAPETVRERLRVYHEQTAPLIGYYEAQGILATIEGQEELEDTTRLTLEALGSAI